MAQITDLNVSPYYDDFDEADNFHRVLFRPGFAIQARELTQLQSILQNQVERHGNHMFKEGSIVIPGQLSYSNDFPTLQLASTFASETIDPTQYFDATNPVTVTGVTSGVKAYVTGFQAATATTQPILYLNYYKTGSDNSTTVFADGENITADKAITHTTGYATSVASATTFATDASAVGSAATIEEGIIYIRGQFVKVSRQTLLLSSNSATESARVGLTINEELITPEVDSTLTDNSRGSSNFAAKGAHRLKINLTLSKLDVTSTEDSKFIEMMRIDSGTLVSKARETEYSVLGDVLARRTFDESGDYTVKPFLFDTRESVTNTVQGKKFTGVYTSGNATDDGGTASESLLALSCSAGKAYVRGYEFEKLGTTFKDLNKARDFTTINAGVTNLELGNFVRITNLYGTPDIGSVSGETTPYKEIKLLSGATVTRGTSSTEEPIGVARARALEYDSGVSGNTDAVYKAHLFDIRTFTVLTLSDTPSPLLTATHSTGVQVKGVSSGATGLVFNTDISAADGYRVRLTNVVGAFTQGEKLIASDSAETGGIIENSSNADLTISLITTRTFSETRQLFMDDADAGQDFTADVELTKRSTGDLIQLNATDASLANANDNILLEEDGSTELGIEPLREAVLVSPEKNVAIYKLPKTVVKTLLTDSNNNSSDTTYTVRRQFVATSNSSGVITVSAGSNEVFGSFTEADYVMSILSAGGGSGVQGQLVPISGKISGTGSSSVTITDNTILGSGAKVKLIATIIKSSVVQKNKTTNLSKQVKVVASDADGAYGCRATDKEISLGRADVFRLQAVFDSGDTSADATAPTLTLGTVSGTFTRGEKITGSSSGAEARIVTTTSPIQYVLTNGFGAIDFTTSDTITGESSGASSTVSTVTAGSKVITSNFTLDTGQRDNFYDIARLFRKSGAEKPLGRLLVVFDFFSHGSGDFFSVDSYSAVGGQMNYDDILTYSATKIDPDDPKPSGLFDLKDCLDFRPTAENIAGASDTLTAIDTITATASSFDFTNRQFDGTGAVAIDTPKINNALICDFEHYLPRKSVLYIGVDGEFKIVDGVPAEDPQFPAVLDNAMKLATIDVPAFTFTPSDVTVTREQTQRFTMKDIGKLQNRIENLEYYTSLNLLERDAESLQIADVNGLNRFKSGFIVDNFSGHKVGDVIHPDYKIAIDMENNELRPKCVMKAAKLVEKVTTDSARATAGYQKTGDLLTLPYTEKDFITQPYATRPENIQSALIYEYVGKITLTPSGDEWFETEQAPDLVVNVDGNFDAVTASVVNQMGTIWNAWETQWSGLVSREVRIIGRGADFGLGFGLAQRTITNTRSDQQRTGISTRVVEQTDNIRMGTRTISQAVIPFVRPRTITGTGECFRPNTRLYAFFDGTDVSSFITPASESYTNLTTNIVEGNALISDIQGKVEFSFRIPEYRFAGQQSIPKFKTGDVDFRLTSDDENKKAPAPSTVGQTIYTAKGIVNTEQQTIHATRNARVIQETVTQTQTVTSQATQLTRHDPLAQTFLISEKGGCFIPSVDIFFSKKDNNLPVWVELREVINGYPGPTLIPFGRKVLNPNDINLDATTGNTPTNFKFDSPVYLKEGIEYCLVVMTNSLDYKVWIAGLGEADVSGSNRIISTQPHLGSFFKSQNNTTWSPVQSEDLKFTMKKCNFTSGSGTVTLQNDNIGDEVTAEDGSTTVYGQRLGSNPIVLTNSSTVVRVKHADHGMYSTSNNVTITGVSSDVSTTLNGAITAAGTSVVLTSATGFPSSGTVHIKINNEIMSGTISGTTISSITRGQDSTTAVAHSNLATVELYMINAIPLTEINKTHTAIANIGIDSYTVASSTSASISGASTTKQVGGVSVYATENYRYETVKTIIGTMELPDTSMTASIKTTNATSPAGTETSFGQSSTNTSIPLNENFDLDRCSMVASTINEANEIGSNKSLELPILFTSQNSNVSPVIDLDRRSFIAIGNRINNVDSSSDVFPTTDFVASTEPDGDQNAAIYLTKAVTLEQAATAIRIVFSAHKQNTSEIKVMFKTLRTSDSSDFDDLGYEFFNTDGSPDSTVPNSLVKSDFQEYVYTAGVNDDGVGLPLDDFIQFQIKIVMQGTDASKPVRIKDLRAIALST
jgi:hypothetical protein